jgi:hypothetical protein
MFELLVDQYMFVSSRRWEVSTGQHRPHSIVAGAPFCMVCSNTIFAQSYRGMKSYTGGEGGIPTPLSAQNRRIMRPAEVRAAV